MRVRLSASARKDLAGVWTFTAKRWNDAQADRYLRLIADRLEDLSRGTAVGRSAGRIRPGYMRLAAGSHLIFYRVGVDALEVVRILHCRMDPERHL